MTCRLCRTQLLIVAAIVSLGASMAAQSGRAQDDADQKALYNYVLTMDTIHKLGTASRDLDALAKSNPDLANAMENTSGGTLDQTLQAVQKHPQAAAVLTKNGLTPREYVVAIMTLAQAGIAVAFKKAGMYKEYPPDMLKLVSPGNLAFVEQHYDEISKAVPSFSPSGDKDK